VGLVQAMQVEKRGGGRWVNCFGEMGGGQAPRLSKMFDAPPEGKRRGEQTAKCQTRRAKWKGKRRAT